VTAAWDAVSAIPSPELIEEAARCLAFRGSWEPGDSDGFVDQDMVDELIAVALDPCPVCRTADGLCRNGSDLADHWEHRRQQAWERSLPVRACPCGRPFKVVPEFGSETYFEACDDGLLGEAAGHVRRAGGRVAYSDACPGCRRPFAVVSPPGRQRPAARRAGQGALF
jgi:hypothetical protein